MKLNKDMHEGKGTPFFRCTMCSRPVPPWDIAKGGCQACGSGRLIPTNLTFWEKVILIIKYPKLLLGDATDYQDWA